MNGEFQVMPEVAYTPSIDVRYSKKISLTYWYTPTYASHTSNTDGSENIIESGTGIAFSSYWLFNNAYMPFIRFGISNGNGENLFVRKIFKLGMDTLLNLTTL